VLAYAGCGLSSVTTAQARPAAPCVRRLPACETDIPVGFSPLMHPPQGDISAKSAERDLFAPGESEFALCPATLLLSEKLVDLGPTAGSALDDTPPE
jgi:hypothetical protein